MTDTIPGTLVGQPGRDDLTPRIFRALYQDFDLLTVGVVHIVTPKGTPVFIGDSLGEIVRQISDHEHGVPALPSSGTPPAEGRPARLLPGREPFKGTPDDVRPGKGDQHACSDPR